MNSDPFASVRLTQSKQQKQSNQSNREKSEDPFESVRLKKSEDIPFLYEAGRHAARISSRIAETIGGIPGDVNSLIRTGVIAGINKITGSELSPEKLEEFQNTGLPTSGKLKELSEETTEGFTKAKNETEEFGDRVAETIAGLVGPMKFRKALGVAVGAESAKEGVKLLGLGEGPQEAAKLGTMLLITALNPGGAMKYAGAQYEKANSLSKGASIQATNFQGNLQNLQKDLKKGVTTTAKNAVLKPIEDLLGKVKNNKILVHDLTAAKRDLNSIMKDPALLSRERKLLKLVGKEVDKAIKPYELTNSAFSKAYRPANEIYGAVMQGTKAYDFIKKGLGTKSILGAALAETALGHPELAIPTIGGAIGAMGAAKSADFFIRVAKSKELQKYYTKAIAAAMKEDLPSLRIYADKIEEEFNKTPLYHDQNATPNKTLKPKKANNK